MEAMSINDDIEALEKALEAGPTPGPWHTGTQCPGRCCWHVFQGLPLYSDGTEDDPGEEILTECGERDATYLAACSPDRIRRLLDALKECQKWHQAARLLHESREAKLSKAIELLKKCMAGVPADSAWELALLNEIHAFLSQDSQT